MVFPLQMGRFVMEYTGHIFMEDAGLHAVREDYAVIEANGNGTRQIASEEYAKAWSEPKLLANTFSCAPQLGIGARMRAPYDPHEFVPGSANASEGNDYAQAPERKDKRPDHLGTMGAGLTLPVLNLGLSVGRAGVVMYRCGALTVSSRGLFAPISLAGEYP
jgi:hypothetical protein